MKLIFAISMVLIIVLSFVGCEDTSYVSQNSSMVEHSSNSTESQSQQEKEIWIKAKYQDNKSEEAIFNTSFFEGTFNNDSVSNSSLSASVFVGSKYTEICLLEYGTRRISTSNTFGKWYVVNITDSNGNTKKLYGLVTPVAPNMYILEDESYDLNASNYIKEKLGQGISLSFYIYEKNNSKTNYSFFVESGNFSKLL